MNTSQPFAWLLSDEHWFNAEPRHIHLIPVPSWLVRLAEPWAVAVSGLTASTFGTAATDPSASIHKSPTPVLAVEFLTAELWMIFAPVIFYWTYSTWLFVLSHLKLTMFEVHRIPTDQPLRKPNKVTVRKVLFTVFLQHVVQSITALVLVVLTRPENVAEWRMESPLLAFVKFMIATVLLDTYQYWMHRWMHVNRALYRRFHSVHHELTVPFAYGALYNHPVEGFLMDTVGGAIPSLILNMHPWTSAIFYSISTLKTVDDHCGYSWAWSPANLFNANGAAYHDIHHWGKGRMYNFSQPYYTFWDHIMGTEYESSMARLREKREKELATGLAKNDADSDTGSSVSSTAGVRVLQKSASATAASAVAATAVPSPAAKKAAITSATKRNVGTSSSVGRRMRNEAALETPSNSSDEGGSEGIGGGVSRSSRRISQKNKNKSK